ncbi:MAG: hypothetical protein IJ272_00060, partial [Clostridia bacterium]|nr:hypothetical protein [Clostridia bacterium]
MKKIIGLFLIVVMMMSIYITEDAYAASINKSSITLTKNKTYKLKLKGTSIRKVSTSNKKVATISKTGVVKAKGKGTCTVSLKGKDNKTYKCKVKVQTPKLNATSITLTKGKKFDLNLTGTLKAKTWSTSNSKVATITRGGVVKALSKGT